MAQCVVINPDGTLTQTADTVETCAGYVMVSGSEYQFYALVQKLVEEPTPEAVAQVWSIGFFLPLICYAIAYGVGRIAGMFTKD